MNENKRIIKDYKPETRSLLRALASAGFTLCGIDNGGGRIRYSGKPESEVLEEVLGADEAHLYFQFKNHPTVCVYLVFGNSPGELVCDYSGGLAELEAVISAHATHWDGRPQPTQIV